MTLKEVQKSDGIGFFMSLSNISRDIQTLTFVHDKFYFVVKKGERRWKRPESGVRRGFPEINRKQMEVRWKKTKQNRRGLDRMSR